MCWCADVVPGEFREKKGEVPLDVTITRAREEAEISAWRADVP
jgi:hypothetical protein